jgi:Mg-chelatase subunit ChlD
MAPPAIVPNTLGSAVYTATNSAGLLVDLALDVPSTPPFAAFSVRFPAAAAPTLILQNGAVGLALPVADGDVNADNPFPKRKIVATAAADGADIVVAAEIRATANPALKEAWTVRADAAGPVSWQVVQEYNQPAAPTIRRIACDPVAAFTAAAPSLTGDTVREKDTVIFTAAAAIGTATAPTVIGAPIPAVEFGWSKTGPVVLNAFPATGASPTLVCNLPTVYGARSVSVTERATFVGTGLSASATQDLSIIARPQRLALVLDRSGSMAGDRWANAVIAAEILASVFVTMRASVHPEDRLALLVFDDTTCSWHAAPIASSIQPALALSSIADAANELTSVPFGAPGACTPIGDALLKAVDDFAAAGVAEDPHFTVVLLTDGYENSGTVIVDPNTPQAAGTQRFAVARQAGPRFAVNAAMSLYTIGFGATVQEDVLDALAVGSGGAYAKLTQIDQLREALGQMAAFAAGVQCPAVEPAAAGAGERVVKIGAGARRIAFSVLVPAAVPGDVVELSYLSAAGGNPVAVAGAVTAFGAHVFVAVDVAALFGGDESAVAATEWHIVRKNGNSPVPIADGELLAFEDLFIRADVVFDRDRYDTGDPIGLTCRIRAGDDPVLDARVHAELARPGESLGSFLATGGSEYRPPRPQPPDPNAPKAQMISTLLRRAGRTELPVVTPGPVFEDGSAELVDADGTGDYRNRFIDTDTEGSYAWRFTINGRLADGSEFSRLLVVSRWVGVSVDPDATRVDVAPLEPDERFERWAVTVYPRDRRGQQLGPFRPADVRFDTDTAAFEVEVPESGRGVVYPLPDGGVILSRYDGGYTRVLRSPRGVVARAVVTVKGTVLPVIYLGAG